MSEQVCPKCQSVQVNTSSRQVRKLGCLPFHVLLIGLFAFLFTEIVVLLAGIIVFPTFINSFGLYVVIALFFIYMITLMGLSFRRSTFVTHYTYICEQCQKKWHELSEDTTAHSGEKV